MQAMNGTKFKKLSMSYFTYRLRCFIGVILCLSFVTGCHLMPQRQVDDVMLSEIVERPDARPPAPEPEPEPERMEDAQPRKPGLLAKIFGSKKDPRENEDADVLAPEQANDSRTTNDAGPVVTQQAMSEEDLRTRAEVTGSARQLELPLQVGDSIGISLGDPIGWDSSDKIDGQGNINLPIIGAFPAAGKTASELERAISKIYVDKADRSRFPSRYDKYHGEILLYSGGSSSAGSVSFNSADDFNQSDRYRGRIWSVVEQKENKDLPGQKCIYCRLLQESKMTFGWMLKFRPTT